MMLWYLKNVYKVRTDLQYVSQLKKSEMSYLS